jgi:hypothetical protein
LRYGENELNGPYFPGRLIGDHGWLCIRPDLLSVVPRDGRPGMNQVPAALARTIEKPDRVRLEFAGDLAVEVDRAVLARFGAVKEWVIEFPQAGLRIL